MYFMLMLASDLCADVAHVRIKHLILAPRHIPIAKQFGVGGVPVKLAVVEPDHWPTIGARPSPWCADVAHVIWRQRLPAPPEVGLAIIVAIFRRRRRLYAGAQRGYRSQHHHDFFHRVIPVK